MSEERQTVQEILDTPLGPNQSVMAIMNETGDYKIIWDRTKPDEVKAARKQFDEWKGTKKYQAYSVNRSGDRGEILREFDPEAQSIIFSPPMQGGC